MKRGLHWGGSGLAITGIFFVVRSLHNYGDAIDFARFGAVECSTGRDSLLSTHASLVLALAWWNMLKQFGATTSCRWAKTTYGASQIAKYVPGNIFHFAGRQAKGMAMGLAGWAISISVQCGKLGLRSASGGLFGLLALPLTVPGMLAEIGAVAGIEASLL